MKTTTGLLITAAASARVRRSRLGHTRHGLALVPRVRSMVLLLALLGAGLAGVAHGQVVTEFPIPTSNSSPSSVAIGPDGNLWFTESFANQIGRITTAGVVTEFPIPTFGSGPSSITAGPDGNLWFTEYGGFVRGHKIGRITTTGTITEFSTPTAGSRPRGIAAGPDGNLWFTEQVGNQIGRITTAGVITEFLIHTAHSGPSGITAGPDGNLWFTEAFVNRIGRITTAGVITHFLIPTAVSAPTGITAGPDGNLWFTEVDVNKIGRITTDGEITEFPIPADDSRPRAITTGPDGSLWFTETFANQIGQITTDGVITEFPIPTASSYPEGIAAGPDGNVWFTEGVANQIGRIIPPPAAPKPMEVDVRIVTGGDSDGNGMLEPGETVQVAPSWKNTLTISQTFTGTASNLTGPDGPTYTIDDSSADFGTVSGGATADCESATGDCYLMTVSGARPAAHWDATFTEDLSSNSITTIRTLHVGESFPDVPTSDPFYGFIENLFHNGVTGGCAGGNFCPTAPVTRAQMAAFLLKGKFGANQIPPPATGTVFNDVHVGDPFADWIEQLAGLQITGGCGNLNYCPDNPVTRAQMAVFLLKARHGSAYAPPQCTGVFTDVACPSQFAGWIEQLAALGITAGCGDGNYCPDSPNTRGQMAVFLVKTFSLQIYGP